MEQLRAGLTRWRECDRRGGRVSPPVIGLLVCVTLAITLGVAVRAAGTETGAPSGAHLVGQPAPDFALPAIYDGRQLVAPVRLSDHRGHPVLIVFFFSLCPHCAPTLEHVRAVATSREHSTLRVLYIDSPAETLGIASDYAQRLQLDAPLLLDASGQVAARYGVSLYPTIVLVGSDGVVRQVWTGEVSEQALTSAVNAALQDQRR